MEAETWLSTGRHQSPVAVIVTPPTKSISFPQSKQRQHAAVTVESSTPESDAIPMSYVNTIVSAFGPDADLYHDVLDIPRHCSLRDTRIAYFRRGRQVLAEHSVIPQPYQTAASVGGNVSALAKLRFQAVSMAYEILTNDKWKTAYHTHGLQPENISVNIIHVTPTTATTTTPLLRRSSSMDSTRRKSHHAVRWNEEVEELVFNQHPSELSKRVDDNNNEEDGNSSRKKKKGRKKKRAVIETEELRSHLEHLDREAERHFVSDFLDDLETSFDDLLSLGSKKSVSHDFQAEEGNDYDNDEEKDQMERTPNKRVLQNNSTNSRKTSSTGTLRSRRAAESDHPKQPIPSQRTESPRHEQNKVERKQNKKNSVVTANDHHVKQLTYEFPEIFIDKGMTHKVKDDGNSTVVTSDSVSTLSASIVDKRVAMNTSRGAPRPSNLDRLPDVDDHVNTSNDSIIQNPSTQKSSSKHDNRSVATTDDDFDNPCDAIQAVESWCGPDDMDDLTTTKGTVNNIGPFKSREIREETVSTSTGGTTPRKEENLNEDSYAQYHHFHIHLMTYLNSLTVDLGTWGTAIVPTSLMDAIMLSEEDLDGMLDILRTEMNLIPDDFDALDEIEELL